VPRRPARRHRRGEASVRPSGGLAAGVRLVFGTPALRTPMLLGWIAAFYNAPEGIAAPFARVLGGGAAGDRACCWPRPRAGYTVGALAYSRLLDSAHRARLHAARWPWPAARC